MILISILEVTVSYLNSKEIEVVETPFFTNFSVNGSITEASDFGTFTIITFF